MAVRTIEDKNQLRRLAESQLGLPSPLHEFQWEGVSFLCKTKGGLLADEMGLGKTVQASVAIALLLETSQDVNRVLVVAPVSLTYNWISELTEWAPSVVARRVEGKKIDRIALYNLPIQVLVSSYEYVRLDAMDAIPRDCFDLVVLDEAQRIKERTSATSLTCRILPRSRSWALTATPLENKLEDIATILDFLDPKFGRDRFRGDIDRTLANSMLRRRKKDVRQELPPVIVQDVRVGLEYEQQAQYDTLWATRNSYFRFGDDANITKMLGLITRLKTICNYDKYSGTSSKFNALETVLDSVGNSARVIVFSQFVQTLKWLSSRLSISHDLLVGSMDLATRHLAIERFKTQNSPRVLLVSIRAGGVGLNLEEATHVVMFDRWWNPAVENQAIFRAHRFDRTTPLHVIRFIVLQSIEEHIASILDKKAELFEDIVESSRGVQHGFDRSELIKILGISYQGRGPDTYKNKEH